MVGNTERIWLRMRSEQDFEAEGYRVLRFWNNDVLANTDGVLEAIQSALTTTPTPNPSPRQGVYARLRRAYGGGE